MGRRSSAALENKTAFTLFQPTHTESGAAKLVLFIFFVGGDQCLDVHTAMFIFSENHKLLTQSNSKHVTHCSCVKFVWQKRWIAMEQILCRWEKENPFSFNIFPLQDKVFVS